jgi:hypothetical protein
VLDQCPCKDCNKGLRKCNNKGQNQKAIEWTVVTEHEPPSDFDKDCTDIGISGLDVDALSEDKDLARVFLHLFRKDWIGIIGR